VVPVYEEVSRSPSAMSAHDYGPGVTDQMPYIPVSEACATWPTLVQPCSVTTATVSTVSTVSSPASTPNEEYAYLPGPMPRLQDAGRLPPTSMPLLKSPEHSYDDVDAGK